MFAKIIIQYIHHSGFQIETKNHIFIFDYYKGTIQLGDKDTYVFSSHSHPDHYNPQIFDWQEENPEIKYILSNDIPLNKDLKLGPNLKTMQSSQKKKGKNRIYLVSPYDELQIDDIRIKVFGSTDIGVSFLVQADDSNIFHAGDLNWWHWWGESPEERQRADTMFKEEMAKIKQAVMDNNINIDIAFFPVDPRLKHNYSLGADYFIREISPTYLVPMHFWDDYETLKKYALEIKDSRTKVIEITRKEQVFELSK